MTRSIPGLNGKQEMQALAEIDKDELKEAMACIKTAQKYGSGAPDYDDDPKEILEWYRKGL